MLLRNLPRGYTYFILRITTRYSVLIIGGVMLPKYTYLYGMTKEDVVKLKDTAYEDALKYKIKMAKELNERLLIPEYMTRDNTRINDVQKAIKFNEMLLGELK